METWESGWVRGRDGNMGVRVGEGGGMETWESGWVRGEGWKHGSQGG